MVFKVAEQKILQAEHAPWKRMYENSTFTSQDQLQIIRTANATGFPGLFRQRNLSTDGLMREILQTLSDISSWTVIYDSDVFPIFFPRNQGTVLKSPGCCHYQNQESWGVFPVDVSNLCATVVSRSTALKKTAEKKFMDSWPIDPPNWDSRPLKLPRCLEDYYNMTHWKIWSIVFLSGYGYHHFLQWNHCFGHMFLLLFVGPDFFQWKTTLDA